MRLRSQLAVTLAVLAGAAAVSASLASYRAISAQSANETDTFLEERVAEVERFSNGFGAAVGSDGTFGPDDGFGPFGRIIRVDDFAESGFPFVRPDADTVFLDADGEPQSSLSTVDLGVTAREVDVAVTRTGEAWRTTTVDGRTYRVLTAPLDGAAPAVGAVQVARDITETNDVLARLRVRLAIANVAVVALAALLGWAMARRLARPLERLSGAATEVAATKRFDTRLDGSATGEVGDVTDSFNQMLSELERSRRQQQQLVADADHELRTPIATLSANLELLDRPSTDPAEHAEILDEARTQLQELATLAGQLTSAANTQFHAAAAESMSLGDVAEQAITRMREPSRAVVTITNPATIRATPDTLVRAIANLLTNAEKYAHAETPINVHVDHDTLTVRDTGPGIEPGDIERIFAPFFRAATARSAPGSGLGLALVKQIIDDHGGEIEVVNDGGAVFTVVLPAAS